MTVSVPAPPDILSSEYARDPYEAYRILLEYYPVLFHAPTNSWLVSRHEDVFHLFKTKDVSSENYAWQLEPVHGRTIIQMEGKEHTKHRSLLNPFFHGLGLEAFTPTIEASAHYLGDPLFEREGAAVRSGAKERGSLDLVPEFTHQFPITVIEEMLALPKKDHPDFERWYVSIMEFLTNLSGAQEPIDAGLRTRQELAAYMLPLIAERRTGDGDDLLSRMCRAEIDGERLSDAEICGFVSLMLTAGGETTDRALANMFAQLIANPEQLQAVYEDRSLVTDAFAETLRFAPPVHMIMRQTEVDVELQGVVIPAGSTITCMLGAANRDPRKFADPDTFDIFRTDNDTRRAFTAAADHVGFINGRHFCVGAMLARTEVELAANLLLDHLQDLRFADGFVPEEEGIFTRAPNHLEVTFVPA